MFIVRNALQKFSNVVEKSMVASRAIDSNMMTTAITIIVSDVVVVKGHWRVQNSSDSASNFSYKHIALINKSFQLRRVRLKSLLP